MTAGSTAARADRCRNFRRPSFMTALCAATRARHMPGHRKVGGSKGRPPMAATLLIPMGRVSARARWQLAREVTPVLRRVERGGCRLLRRCYGAGGEGYGTFGAVERLPTERPIASAQ